MIYPDRHLGFDLHRNIERQPRHADGGARVGARVGAEHLQDQVGEAVDHRREPVEPGAGVDHAEYPQPRLDPVQVAQRLLQAGQDRQGGQPSGRVALFLGQIGADLAQWFCQRPVRRQAGRGRTRTLGCRTTRTQGNGSTTPGGGCIGGGSARPSAARRCSIRAIVAYAGVRCLIRGATSCASSRSELCHACGFSL